jgi:hypothetical protein
MEPDYKGFAMWCLNEGPFNGCDLDGGSVQDAAVKFGIIKEVKYDPKIHGETSIAESGDPWFVPVHQ